ncbi:MAG TPA: hypothetical protein VFO96_10485 [Gemmatimonadales bacterium]|jgi:hypothetical protein|nr:hypothetical protein [Gemmatimonadales bacterium]
MIPLLLFLQAAGQGPTVGDTVWVRRAVRLPAGYTARAPEWKLSGDVELLGPPAIELRGDSAILRAPLVAWTPGAHEVEVPAPELLAPDGSLNALPQTTARFTIRPTLPNRPVTELRPQPEAGIIGRRTVSWLPLLLLTVVALLLLVPLHWYWRRRGKPLPVPAPPPLAAVPASRWADAGEARSVLAAAAARLRRSIAARFPDAHEGLDTASCLAALAQAGPDWPLADLARLLTTLDAARFAPGTPDEVLALYAEAEVLAERLEGVAA